MGAKVGGKGGGKFDLGQNSDINVTPFVDVMLVLLIIFMVTAPLATVSIKIDLPPPIPNQPPPPEKPVFISIQPYGKLYIRGTEETTLQALPADLLAALGGTNPREKQVLIQASRDVIYRDFMSVLNVLQGNGFFKVGLISEEFL